MQAAKNFRNPARIALQAGILAAAAAFIYRPSIHGDFLWDDGFETSQTVATSGWASLKALWVAPSGPDYYPLKATLEWLQWHLWHGDSLGFHAVNVALHLACALLLWRILVLLGIRAAWFGSLLFTVHPLCVESVAWMSEFKNTSSLFLLLLSFLAFLKFDRLRGGKGARLPYALSAAGFLAAMLCKSSVAAFPAALLLFAWWRRGRLCRRDLLETAPFFAVSAGLSAVTIVFQVRQAIGRWAIPPDGVAARIAGFPKIAGFYLWKFIWPRTLMPIYPRWDIHPLSLLSFTLWALLLAAFVWAWTRRAGWGRHVLFGAGWFLINLLPVSGIVPMAFLHLSRAADHLVYLPMIGLVGLSAAAFGALPARFASWPAALRIAAAAACTLLALRARRYDARFTDEVLLWTTNERLNPGSASVHGLLADAFSRLGRTDAEIREYEQALRLAPGDEDMELGLAQAYLDAGRTDEAATLFNAGIRQEPDPMDRHRRSGQFLSKAGRYDEAASEYSAALALDPRQAVVENELGYQLAHLNRMDEAISHYRQALLLQENYPEADNNLGLALAAENRREEAMAYFHRALSLAPRYAEAHNNLGYDLIRLGRPEEAIPEFKEAIRLRPEFAEAENNLALALSRTGRRAEAIDHLRRALEISPGDASAHYNLGVALLAGGGKADADAQFREALRLRPDFREAQKHLDELQKP